MTINILLVDDSSLVRQVVTDILHESPDIRVIGCACNGRAAVDMTLALKPDLVVMDLLMPVLDGIGAIEEIMACAPTPVLVLSAAVEATDVDRAFNAIKRGALDVMEKPTVDSPGALQDFAVRLVEKVRLLSGIRVIRHPRWKPRPEPVAEKTAPGALIPNILAIGASTGGPKAVMTVLKSLPADFRGTVFIVQHIAEGFADGFANWLDRECALPVRLATDGARYAPGEALVAPNGYHMTVSEGRIRLTCGAPVNCCRPSIDVFFASLAQGPCGQVVSLLLSGMGKDGAQGLLRIKERGGRTLVQDEPSCAVFGMPKAAILLQAVDEVLPIDGMPAAISKLFTAR
jgi:two-component system, chemotaxis family, protein-glutamate methylesterase/glutaminase